MMSELQPGAITARQLNELKKIINAHFAVDIPCPKFLVVHNPNTFFNKYTGLKRLRSVPYMIKLNHQVQFYYDHEKATVVFKGFERDGEHSFGKVEKQSQPLSNVVHEYIHHIQYKAGGYGDYDFFDEATCETATYVLTNQMDKYGQYFNWVSKLWHLLDTQETKSLQKYKMICDYIVSDKKQTMHNEWMEYFLDENKKIIPSRKTLLHILHSDGETEQKVTNVLAWRTKEQVIDEFFKVRDAINKSVFITN